MEVKITYKEILDFIEKRFRIRPVLTSINEKNIEVSYKPAMFMPAIGIKFRIEEIGNNNICISYECGTAAALILAGAVTYLKENIPNGIKVNTNEQKIDIRLKEFKQIEKVLEYVILSDITFCDNSINAELRMA